MEHTLLIILSNWLIIYTEKSLACCFLSFLNLNFSNLILNKLGKYEMIIQNVPLYEHTKHSEFMRFMT